MPHLTLEYSANLEQGTDATALCWDLRAAIMGSGLVEFGAVRVRAFAASHYAFADLGDQDSILDMSFRIGHGRTPDQAKPAGELIFAAASKCLSDLLAKPHFAMLLEVRDINSDLSWKMSAIHPRLRAANRRHGMWAARRTTFVANRHVSRS